MRLTYGETVWENGQKLHENYKIKILGGKTVGDIKGQVGATFWVVGVGDPSSLPPLLGETLGGRPHYLKSITCHTMSY